MRLITPPLAYDDHGPEVANLHEGLVALLRAGRIELPDPDESDLLDRLADADGAAVYGPATRDALRAFALQHGAAFNLPDLGGERVDEPTAEALNRLLREEDALDPADQPRLIVRGRVEYEDGAPAADLVVDIFDRDLGDRRSRLGAPDRRYVTRRNGVFPDIYYTEEQFARGEGRRGPSADLVFELTAREDERPVEVAALYRRLRVETGAVEQSVAEPALGIAAARVEEVRIVLARRDERAQQTEYARLIADLRPLLGEGRTPADLDEESHRDVSFAARETGDERALIETLAAAWRLARQAEREPDRLAETFYGLLRDGEPATLPGLPRQLSALLERDADWEPKLRDSLDLRFIGGEARAHLGHLAGLRAAAADRPGADGRASVGDVLRLAGVADDARRELLTLYGTYDGPIEQFWRDAGERPGWGRERVRDVQAALRLADLTAYHLPLMQDLRERGVASPRNLAGLDRAALAEMVARAGPHPDVPGERPEERVAATVDGIAAQLEAAYPTEVMAGVAARAHDPGLAAARDLVGRFFARETAADGADVRFDIRTTPVSRYLEEHRDRVFAGLDDAACATLTEQLQRVQRTFQLSDSADQARLLLEHGIDSAFAVTRFSREHFVAQFADRLGGPEATGNVYERAETIRGTLLLLFADAWKEFGDVSPRGVAAGDLALPALRELPGYEELFGNLELCDCEHCRSVYSPAAYFVDLLHMLDYRTRDGRNPVEVLFARRPDLGHIQLTCENTNTLIPHVDLVAEILESFIANRRPMPFNQPPPPPHDRLPAPTAEELAVNPIYLTDASVTFAEHAHAALQEAAFPLNLPLNLPLETLRVYLEHLGTSRAELMAVFETDNHVEVARARAAETLRLSPEEFELATGTEFGGASAARPGSVSALFGLSDANTATQNPGTLFNHVAPEVVRNDADPDRRAVLIKPVQSLLHLLGVPSAPPVSGVFDAATEASINEFRQQQGLPQDGRLDGSLWAALDADGMPSLSVLLCHVPAFLARAGLDYPELVALVRTRFLNPTLEGDADRLERLGITPNEIAAWIRAGLGAPPPGLLTKLQAAGEDVAAFTTWVDDRQRAVVLNAPLDAPCDLDRTTLMHLDGTLLSPDELVALFRFLRLWKKLGWTLAEMDLALPPGSLTGPAAADALILLANVAQLRERLELPVAEIVSLWDRIPTMGERSLYDRLFRNRAALLLDPVLELSEDRERLKVEEAATPTPLSDHVPPILAAFRLSAEDMALLRAATGLADDPDATPAVVPLTLAGLSALHRHVALARALGLSVRALLTLLDLSESDPFERPDSAPGGAALELAEAVRTLTAVGIEPSRLAYLFRHVAQPPAVPGPQRETWLRTLGALRRGLAEIRRDTEVEDDPEGRQLAARLTGLLGPEDAEQVARIVHGLDTYAERAPALTSEPSFPASLKAKASFDAGRRELRFVGAMTNAERGELEVEVGIPPAAQADYQKAVAALYERPRALARRALKPLFEPADTDAILFADSSLAADGSPTAAAIAAKAGRLLDRLGDVLSRALVKETLSGATGLPTDVVALLLEDETVISAAGGGPAIADFLDLGGDGLAAAYFGAPDLAGPPVLERTDSTVDFNWGTRSPAPGVVPDDGFSARWRGYLFAPIGGEVTFRVTAGDGVRLSLEERTVLDEWRDQPATPFDAAMRLEGGQFYPLTLEYYERTGEASVELRWAGPSLPNAVVPRDVLYTEDRLEALLGRVERLHKLAELLAPFNLTAREVETLVRRGDLTLDAIPPGGAVALTPEELFKQWLALAHYAALRDALPPADVAFIDVLNASSPEKADARFLRLSGWSPATFEGLITGFTAHDFDPDAGAWKPRPPDLTTLDWWRRIAAAGGLAHRTGAAPRQLFAWARAREVERLPTGPRTRWYTWLARDKDGTDRSAENRQLTQAAKDVARAKYDDEEWRAVAVQLNDVLRGRRRSALSGFVLAMPSMIAANVTDGNRLFEYFLIDVEMDPCMQTSRIKQGISSVQLFIQRCLLNLESPAARPADIDKPRWEWSKNFRVWEANRKVFLYPENWIEPELRDDKSPFFKELEAELLQDELTDATAERAYRHYLGKLDAVARPVICALANDRHAGALHFFARTPNAPYAYYHRRLEQRGTLDWADGVWTPWEQLPVDITAVEDDDRSGVHLLPVFWNRRLYLFWPLFERRTREGEGGGLPENVEPATDWQIRLAWSEYSDGRWSPKSVSTTAVVSAPLEEHVEVRKQYNRIFVPKKVHVTQTTVTESSTLGAAIVGGVLGGPVGAAAGASAAEAFGSSDVKIEEWDEEVPATITWNEDQLLSGTRLDPGDWAQHIHDDHTNVLRRLSPRPADHFLDAEIGRDGLTIGVFNRFSGIPIGKGRRTIEDKTRVVKGGQRTDRKDRVQIDVHSRGKSTRLHQRLGEFSFPACAAEATALSYAHVLGYNSLRRPPGTSNSFQAHRCEVPLLLGMSFAAGDPVVLEVAPEPFQVIDSEPAVGFNRRSSFSYQDSWRSYLVAWVRDLSIADTPGGAGVFPDKGFSLVTKSLDYVAAGQGSANYTSKPGGNPWLASVADRWLTMAGASPATGYLTSPDGPAVAASRVEHVRPKDRYLFLANYHPYTCNFIAALNGGGLPGLLGLEMQGLNDVAGGATGVFERIYRPKPRTVASPYPREIVDFSRSGAYSLYNWELFFHAPMLIATRLAGRQRFEDARRWFHYVYDPMVAGADTDPRRVWRFSPFRTADTTRVDRTFEALGYTGTDPAKLKLRQETVAAVREWLHAPFRPHLIARRRHSAYMKHVFMKYVGALIDEADHLYRRDTLEAINEATQLYVMVAALMGPLRRRVPAVGSTRPETFQTLRARLDVFSNTQAELETRLPFAQIVAGTSVVGGQVVAVPQSLYFCVPENDRLLALWDTVADRLFKIRHCMNIEGVVRQLPLFDQPIDPGLLVQAVAQGVDIASVLNDLYAPLPRQRFAFMLEKALQMCAEVRAFGTSLLATLEKRDAEELARLRAEQEVRLLDAIKRSKEKQIDEAEESRVALENSARVAQARIEYYEAQIQEGLIPEETDQLANLDLSQERQETGSWIEATANLLNLIPNVSSGTGGTSVSFGGSNLGAAASAVARSYSYLAGSYAYKANRASIVGGQSRREQDWHFQRDLAERELAQVERQIAAARIRKEITQAELRSHETQTEHARAVEDLLRDKFTDRELYGWMEGAIGAVYFQAYQLAFDLAKRAERCYRYERGVETTNFVHYGAWDSAREGLLAGERLYLQLKQLEQAFLERNERELELTKQISVLQLDPLALIALKETGTCEVELPEWLFDLDYAGHYFRRVKTIGLTVPCVVGPYTGVNATLTLLGSKVRESSRVTGDYDDEGNYRVDHRPVEAVASSTGQNDGGLFEVNFRDERYLPFEGAGAISRWRIELPRRFQQFDYDTISDVIFNLRYTARADRRLADRALRSLEDRLRAAGGSAAPLYRLFSLRHEFPNEWHRLRTSADHAATFTLPTDRFPLLVQGGDITIERLHYALILREPRTNATVKLSVTPPVGAQYDVDFQGQAGKRYLARARDVGVSVAARPAQAEWRIRLNAPTQADDIDNIKDVLVVGRYTFKRRS